jgi:hypothetical protein
MNGHEQDPYPPTPTHRLSEYDRKRLEEMNSANLPLFWIVYVLLVVGGLLLLMLTPVPDWLGL